MREYWAVKGRKSKWKKKNHLSTNQKNNPKKEKTKQNKRKKHVTRGNVRSVESWKHSDKSTVHLQMESKCLFYLSLYITHTALEKYHLLFPGVISISAIFFEVLLRAKNGAYKPWKQGHVTWEEYRERPQTKGGY